MSYRSWPTAEQALAYYTECQLATVETLRSRKRVSQSELSRHQKIADGMVEHCRVFVGVKDAIRVSAVRLERILTGVGMTA